MTNQTSNVYGDTVGCDSIQILIHTVPRPINVDTSCEATNLHPPFIYFPIGYRRHRETIMTENFGGDSLLEFGSKCWVTKKL